MIKEGKAIKIPPQCKELHHEVELGVVIEKSGSDIPVAEAEKYIAGYVLALDMTARDLQDVAKVYLFSTFCKFI